MPRQLRWLAGGALLLALGFALALASEWAQRDYRALLQKHGGEVVDLGRGESARSDLQGQLVRVVGTPRVVVAPYDEEFNQQFATPLLTRKVAMFQWRELRLGNVVNYELDWDERAVDSSRFERPAGHANPGPLPLAGQRFQAGSVSLGGYTLGPALVQALPGSEPLAADAAKLPANLAATFAPYQGSLVTSDHPGQPQLGDLRVSWQGVPLQEVTVIGRVDNGQLLAVPVAANEPGYEVNVGDSPLLNMRPDMAERPALPWLRRVLALLLAVPGAAMCWWRARRRAEVRPALGGGLLAVGLGGVLGWLGGSWLAAACWFAVALAGGALLAWRWRARLS